MGYGKRAVGTLGSVALGAEHADLILVGCRLVNVYTREIQEGMQVAISGQRVAYVGYDASDTMASKTKVIDADGRLVAPGFAEPHMHIDQLVTPAEFSDRLLLCGTTSVFSDPIDIVGVAGYRGFREFLRLSSDLPIRIFNMIPGGLPVDTKFGNAGRLTPDEEREAVSLDGVLGLGEVFSWTKVTLQDPRTVSSLELMLYEDLVINGHTAGASDKKLQAYIASGVSSCHEPTTFEQVRERLRLGMWIMIREGSIRRDLDEIVAGILSSDTGVERLMFCADELNPEDIGEYGHIDHCVRRAVSIGMKPADAVAIASRNCFEYYGMGRDLGGIAPGKLADIILFDQESFRPSTVIVGGNILVHDGSLVARAPRRTVPEWLRNTVRVPRLLPADFVVPAKDDVVWVNTIHLITEIVTRLNSQVLSVQNGSVQASRDMDIWKVAAFDRTGKTKRRAVGFIENFGAGIDAFASTKNFHENDLVVIGMDDSSMALAANHLIQSRGGMAVASGGRIVAEMPFEIGGIISSGPFEKVLHEFKEVNQVIRDSGCVFQNPMLVPIFLPFLAIPSIRILHDGMVDVKKREFVPVIASGK